MAKIPGKFKKPVSKKTFEKKFLKYIFIKYQKEFVKKKFGIKDGKVILKEGLNKKEAKQLKLITKTAKKNRGLLRTGKITVLVIIFAAVIIFYTVFMSPLLQKSAEKLFSGIFEAKVEFSKFKFNPLAGEVSFNGLTVADSDNEFRNLFELGPSVLNLQMDALLRKKFVIEEFSASGFAAGTERTTSGFPNDKEEQEIQSDKNDESSSFDNFVSALQVDAKAIIEKESENLVSLKAAGELPAVYQEKAEEYQELYSQSLTDYQSISKTAAEAAKINVNSLKVQDIPKMLTLVQDIEKDIKAANRLVNEYTLKAKQIDKDIKAVSADISSLKSGMKDDIDYIMSFFDLSSVNAKRIGSDLIDSQLSRYLGSVYTVVNKALYYSDRISMSQGVKKEAAEKKKDKGIKVYFPAQKYPSFWLQKTAFDMKDKSFAVNITDISSDPVLSDTATEFETFLESEDLTLEAVGFLDLRPDADTQFSIDLDTSGYSLELSGKLDDLDLSSFTSAMAVSGGTRVDKDGNFSGNVKIVLSEIRVKAADNTSMLGSILESTIKKTGTIRITADFSVPANQSMSVSIDTNLNDLLANAFSEIIDDISLNARNKIERYITEAAGPYLDEAEKYKKQIVESLDKYTSGLSGLQEYKKIFNNKKSAIESQKKKFESGAGEALNNLLQGLF